MVWWKLKLFRMLLERKFLRANNYSSFCVVMLWERNPSYILLWSWLNFIYLLQTLNPLSERPEDERVLWNFLEKFPKWGLNWKKKTKLQLQFERNNMSFWLFEKCWTPLHRIYFNSALFPFTLLQKEHERSALELKKLSNNTNENV